MIDEVNRVNMKVIRIYLEALNVCAAFHDNFTNICLDILVWTKAVEWPTLLWDKICWKQAKQTPLSETQQSAK